MCWLHPKSEKSNNPRMFSSPVQRMPQKGNPAPTQRKFWKKWYKVLLCFSCGYPTSLDKLSTCKQTHSSYFKSPQIIRALFDFEYGTHYPTCVSSKNRGKTTVSSVWCYDCVEHYCKECLIFHSSLPLF